MNPIESVAVTQQDIAQLSFGTQASAMLGMLLQTRIEYFPWNLGYVDSKMAKLFFEVLKTLVQQLDSDCRAVGNMQDRLLNQLAKEVPQLHYVGVGSLSLAARIKKLCQVREDQVNLKIMRQQRLLPASSTPHDFELAKLTSVETRMQYQHHTLAVMVLDTSLLFCKGMLEKEVGFVENPQPDAILSLSQHLQQFSLIFAENPAYLQTITRLYLDSLGLSYLSPHVFQLTNLQLLNLDYNELQVVPAEIGQLTNLQLLSLYHNQLQEVPDCVWHMTKLQELALGYNQLQMVLAEIGHLTNLEVLWLNNNQLQVLPAEIVKLTKLEALRLNNNELQVFPAAIVKLTKLEALWLNNNQLQVFPDEIGELKKLALLNLDKNPWTYLPDFEILPQLCRLDKARIREIRNRLSNPFCTIR